MSPEIYDWEATLHKLVTSSEGDLVGNVDAVDDTNVIVSTEGARTHYRIPKHQVDSMVIQFRLRFRSGNWKDSKKIKERDLVR